MFNNLVVCVLLCILRSLEYAKAQSGLQCVSIQDCPEIYDLLQDPSQRSKGTALASQANCGYNGHIPKVWCTNNKCQTPDGLPGFCQPLQKCASIAALYANQTLAKFTNTNYLQGLRCTLPREKYAVCCPSNEDEFNKRLFGVSTSNLLPDPDKKDCGLFSKPRIIHGEEADLGEYPWVALLLYESSDAIDIKCSGSLISSKYVATAAHCVDRSATRGGKLDRVLLGEHNIETKRDCIAENVCADPPVIAAVESVTIHPEWYTQKRGVVNNDIALVRLVKPVTPTKFISPICLPRPNLHMQVRQVLDVTGWGATHLGEYSPIKLKARVRVSERKSCEQKYKVSKGLAVGDGEFCAEGKEGVDTCTGDSGAPLMYYGNNAQQFKVWFLVGIVSFGHNDPCGEGYFPGLYTDMSKYIDWIKKTIQP